MAIKMRRGIDADFDPTKLVAGEFAILNTSKKVAVAFADGTTKRMQTEEDAVGYVEAAAESASSAATSASEVSQSAYSAYHSANGASQYATNAANSATTATNKAEEAATSATTATNKAEEAATSASNAANSATTATNIATATFEYVEYAATTATNKAEEAATSATNAATSATTATNKATYASNKARAASQYAANASYCEANAATSATAAANSASNAANSEANAATSATQAEEAAEQAGAMVDVALAQKTINNELEYGYFRSTGSSITAVNNKNILQDFAFYGNMNYSDNLITLKANKKYHIIGTFYVATPPGSTTGGVVFIIIDTDGNHLSQRSYSSTMATNNSTILDTIVTPTEDIQVYVKIDAISGNIAYCPVHSSISISEIGHDITIDPVEYVDTDSGLQDAPVGQIISYMGTTAPEHYLVCDGTVYNIADYPHLSDFINTQFGSKNHFGGDGSTTFAVPDLRGEFLRGTGTNSHAGQGSGATVGTHQDGTNIAMVSVGSNGTLYYVTPNQDPIDLNQDSELINRNNTRFDATGTTVTNTGKSFYTPRPTNTSVMYCIKYEPTYYMKNVFMNHREETVLFEGDAHVLDQTYTMVDSYENYDEILIYAATSNGVAPPSNIDTKLIATDDIATTSLYPFMWYASTSWFAYLRIDFATTTTFKVNQVAIGQGVSGDNGYMAIYKIMGIKYNETTWEGGE